MSHTTTYDLPTKGVKRVKNNHIADVQHVDLKHPITSPCRFIDLFCGIGGFRIAFEKVGGQCVFSSDYDKFSQQTYEANFGERPHGDINKVDVTPFSPSQTGSAVYSPP